MLITANGYAKFTLTVFHWLILADAIEGMLSFKGAGFEGFEFIESQNVSVELLEKHS